MKRRDVVRTLCVLGGSAAVGRDLRGRSKLIRASEIGRDAETVAEGASEPMAVLVDTTKCMGCRMCELACAKQNELPEPEPKVDFSIPRHTDDTRFTVVNRYETSKGTVHVKTQCFHCLTPACASACLTQAMHKTQEGPVIWRDKKCMGCRYCMVSCPFDVPKFEYLSANPDIVKCDMCFDRVKEGQLPACVENCPAEALTFGTRRELIAEARRRIHENPDLYYDGIYGEHEAGGTGYLYLSPVPFEQLGFNTKLQKKSYPELSKGFLYAVPSIFVLWPAILLGIQNATKNNAKNSTDHE